MNIFSRLIQIIILSGIKKKNNKPTSIVPLSGIKSAVVLIDWNGGDIPGTIAKAADFFGSKGIRLTVLNPQKRDFTLLGRLRTGIRQPEGKKVPRSEDLFISLAAGKSYAEEYEAFSSPATFKIGRSYFKPGVYDFLIRDREGQNEKQTEVLDAIIQNIQKIK